jgi:hypothetical protein
MVDRMDRPQESMLKAVVPVRREIAQQQPSDNAANRPKSGRMHDQERRDSEMLP